MRLVLVVAAALIDADGRVLLAQRPKGKTLEGLWEFPGGKIDAGEGPEDALIRELKEELGITVKADCLAPLTFASHPYDDFHLLMPLYVCRRWQGFVQPLDGQALKWVRPKDLRILRDAARGRTAPPAPGRAAGVRRVAVGLGFLGSCPFGREDPANGGWISLDSLVRIETFQRVTRDFPRRKFLAPPSRRKTRRIGAVDRGHAEGQDCSSSELTLISDFLQ